MEHVGDRSHKVMCKVPGVSFSVMRTAYQTEWGRTGPVDGSRLCIKGKVDGVIGRGDDIASCSA